MEKENNEKILALAEKFVTETLGSIDSQGKCFAISYPLSLHLENNNFKNSIARGYFKDIFHSHFWLILESDNEIIIDPTKKQFYKNAPLVYIGKKPDDYYHVNDTAFENWIEDVYNSWIIPFHYPDNFEHLDLITLLEINIKAAIIVNNELEKKEIDISNSLKHRIYFSGIFEILNNNYEKLTKFESIKGFANLKLKGRLMFGHPKYHV